MPALFYQQQDSRFRPRIGWRDLVIFAGLFALLYGLLHASRQMQAPYSPVNPPVISLAPSALPVYALRSLLRMFLAFSLSIVFTLIYGYTAAYNKQAEKVLVPLLDILQSVPVLGFLSVTVTAFMALFPGSLLGLECASIFAIFTGQAWNMTFAFYHALKILPKELTEAATVYRLSWWQRFTKLEVPFAMIGLVWNGMMSFGGGWFFLAASEAISVLGKDVKLPGIGSFMATAVLVGNVQAILWAILAMVVLVVLVDQLFWRPVVAWSYKFRFEQSAGGDEPTSVVLDFLRHSNAVDWWERTVYKPLAKRLDAAMYAAERRVAGATVSSRVLMVIRRLLMVVLAAGALYLVALAVTHVSLRLSVPIIVHVLWLGCLTLMRVLTVVLLATVIWTPIGVKIGMSPRLAKVAQPLVQIGASFPANLVFPLVAFCFARWHVDMNWGSILLLALGTQWYILFNIIAGATGVPNDLREAATVFGLRGWTRWRTLILPAVFPAWVTGALTAAGGAWNASIVAEIVSWKGTPLVAKGLGAYIAQTTATGDWQAIVLSIATMSAFVVLLNRILWRPLYAIAEERYRLG